MGRNELFRKEEVLKEEVYGEIDKRISDASIGVTRQRKIVDRGAYEDQAAYMPYRELADAERKKHEAEKLELILYKCPYFAHIEAEMDGIKNNYFLSACERLESMIAIGEDGFLVPFKLDERRAITKALYHCYQSKKGDPISYRGPSGDQFVLSPELICETDIENRELRNVTKYFPVSNSVELQIIADELLEDRLQENRNNPTLRNIISTLQLKQFEIIGREVNESFVVQGCAGSGKSQCLLHRLFFLRDALSRSGWEKVLLLTPTILFRQYSADLMRRYHLSDVNNCSLAQLYCNLLDSYDDRFRERQYKFQLSEEYLPDEYLAAVYKESNVEKIESEIENAIRQYVAEGCKVLGIELFDDYDISAVQNLVTKLDEQIAEFDAREKALQDNSEYQEKRVQYEELLKEVDVVRRKLQRQQEELQKNQERQSILAEYVYEVEMAEREKEEWVDGRKERIQNAVIELENAAKCVDEGVDLLAPAKYARQLFLLKDLTEGTRFASDEDKLAILDEHIRISKRELYQLTNNNSPKSVSTRYLRRQKEVEDNISEFMSELFLLETKLEECATWLRQIASEYEGKEANAAILRSEMQQARYHLSRIESTIFEKEVWSALAPIKDQYNIQTLEIEEVKDGKRKESRILYKSDLLFYVQIYMRLHPKKKLPHYELICIDEGQDLHRADYDVLHQLYPKAAFNVFGDVGQVLHSACGISDWREQTGINTIYPLTTNYRNTAEIADFCIKKFGVEMDYLGKVNEKHKPIVVSDIHRAREVLKKQDLVVIVKDKLSLEELIRETGIDGTTFTFLDTASEKTEATKRECYTIFAAKGLEFANVFVFARNMTKNQKVVACTRAMRGLYYYE